MFSRTSTPTTPELRFPLRACTRVHNEAAERDELTENPDFIA
jgi:hypothetical protein